MVELALSIHKDGLGLELLRDVWLGPVCVLGAYAALPGLRYPLDVSGGVSRFRHRRGELSRLTVEVFASELAAFASPKLRGIVSTDRPEVSVRLFAEGAELSIRGVENPVDESSAPRVLAFQLWVLPFQGGIEVHVAGARGVGLDTPPTALALRAATALFGGLGERVGATFLLPRAAEAVAKAVYPLAGARAPSAQRIRVVRSFGAGDAWCFEARDGDVAEAASGQALSMRESAGLLRVADDALFDGDAEGARAELLRVLDRAPGLPEALRRLAEIDAYGPQDRAEVALQTAGGLALTPLGDLRGALYLRVHDAPAAVAAWLAEADREAVSELAALLVLRAAEALDTGETDALFDRAVATSPALVLPHWRRLRRHLAAGRDGKLDAQHLEALARGAHERFAVLMRLGAVHAASARSEEAASYFERALRYAPDAPEAIAGLGRALLGIGRATRGMELLARAVDLDEARGADVGLLLFDLGRALRTFAGDLPTSIARLSAVRPESPAAIAAKGLEARYRAEAHDLVGASLAFARMRELLRERPDPNLVPWLLEAMRFEESRDPAAAQRHRELANHLAPRAVSLAEAEAAPRAPVEPAPIHVQDAPSIPSPPAPPPSDVIPEIRVEELRRALEARPDDDAVVEELARLLEQLDRGLELLAVLSARLEDAPEDKRAQYLPQQRAVLTRLEDRARQEGRFGEADLYQSAREALE